MTPLSTSSMRWYDYLLGLLWLASGVGTFLWGGPAAVVVYALLMFASYRLGKALGR